MNYHIKFQIECQKDLPGRVTEDLTDRMSEETVRNVTNRGITEMPYDIRNFTRKIKENKFQTECQET